MNEEAKRIVETLRSLLPDKVNLAEHIGAKPPLYKPYMVWTDPEPYAMEAAADIIERLSNETEKQKKALVKWQRKYKALKREMQLNGGDKA